MKLAKLNSQNTKFNAQDKLLLNTHSDGFAIDGGDDHQQILLHYHDEGNKIGQVGGIFDPNDNISVEQFFHNLTKIFKNINFYNLLDITHEQANKDSELVGIDDA